MPYTQQRWEHGPGGPVVGCKVGVHRQHHAAADASTCRRQAQQHQAAYHSLSSFNIAMHSPPSEADPPQDTAIVLDSHINLVAVAKTPNKILTPQLMISSHELCACSQASKRSEGCQRKARRSHVHFEVVSDEPKNRKAAVQSTACNESRASSSSSSIGEDSNNSSCISEKTSQESGEEKEVQSCLGSPLDHMSNLEDSLPIKKSLSRFYNGKSQSFTSLADVSSVGDLAKPENPYAKKRKWLHAHGSSGKGSLGYPPYWHTFASREGTKPLPLIAGDDAADMLQTTTNSLSSNDHKKRVVCARSYSLGDLQGSGC